MSTKHRNRSTLFVTGMAVLAVGLLVAGRAMAGSLDPTNAPGLTMRTLEEIYQKLAGGVAPSAGNLDPTNAPGPTMHTLQVIYDTIPPAQTLSATTTVVQAGIYATTNLTQVDTDLATGNIKAGVTVFGVTGTPSVVDTVSGDAIATDVLKDKKAYVNGALITGIIASTNLSASSTAVAAGLYAATNLTQVDTDLAAGNIATNVTIFGIAGTAGTNGGGGSVTSAVPKTGQTTSYADYDDGWNSTNIGVAWPNPRFKAVAVSGSETNQIKDNLTGLIWARNANFAGGTKTWQGALDFIAATNTSPTLYGGTNDWRLPNRRELESLVNLGETDSSVWLNSQDFAGVQSSDYWSSTTFAGDTGDAWVVGLVYGIIRHLVKISNPYVWPVRGGQ